MNLNDYQIATERTCPDLGSLKLNISHMIMGMVSELEELDMAIAKFDRINIGEELTDIHWYLSNYCRLYNIQYQSLEYSPLFKGKTSVELFVELTTAISSVTDLEKKLLAYNKPVKDDFRLNGCRAVFTTLKSFYIYHNLDMEQCMENNINKLKIRFPDKFTEQSAINRNLEAERIELER